jgi:HEAT repeat protein
LLAAALGDDNVRFDASNVLRAVDPRRAKELGLDQPAAADLQSLRLVLDDAQRQPAECEAAAKALAALGDAGCAVLISAFENPRVAPIAARAFRVAAPSAVRLLLAALAHEVPAVRASAAEALGQLGAPAGDAAAQLVPLLKDSDRDVRYRAVRALHEFGPRAAPAVAALSEVILNPQELEPTRQWGIKTLVVSLPDTHDAVVKALIAAANDKGNYGVSQLARQQLLKIDAQAAAAAGIR